MSDDPTMAMNRARRFMLEDEEENHEEYVKMGEVPSPKLVVDDDE